MPAEYERDELKKAVAAFLEKWAIVGPLIDGMCALQTIRGYPYTGPTLEQEIKRLKDALHEQG